MQTLLIIIGSAVVFFLLLKLLLKGKFNFILPNHFNIRHEIHFRDKQFDEVFSLMRDVFKKELFNADEPYDREQAKTKIENYTVESFRLYVDKNCLTDKVQFIENELEHNQVRLDIAKEKGWGFSTQVRQHCIKIIKQVLEESHGT